MTYFDDLPKRNRNHVVEEEASAAFQKRLLESKAFILQSIDRKDYGTDCQIEVVNEERVTNTRVHVQLKGTERALNADGSVSVEVSRTNLNYLLMQPYSFYVCYHLPTHSLRACSVDEVLRQYDHGDRNWTAQQTLTVSFREELTVERLRSLAALVRSGATFARDRRAKQIMTDASEVPRMLRRSVLEVHVPSDRKAAVDLLRHLYESGMDDVISAAFDRFTAVLGTDDDTMGPCYMAEINLGMDGRSQSLARIEQAITYFRSKLQGGLYQPGSLHYTIGNALSALGDEKAAKAAYEEALVDEALMAEPGIAAQALKNLGSSIERLGDSEAAVVKYREALRLNPDLPEAHNALGNYFVRVGRYEDALEHFDRAIFAESQLGRSSAVAGWKVNVLFNLNEGRAAFREVNALLNRADSEVWIWPWCARQVGIFGRTTPDNARQALFFWRRFVNAHPDAVVARRELMLVAFYARQHGLDIEKAYGEFRAEFEQHIDHFDSDDAAFLWDRLGHWAQNDSDWVEAERCFRKAFELNGGHYGYCLGTALNFLDRCEESLPILLEQAEIIQADALSWFQVAVAYETLGRTAAAIDAYSKALTLDPNYDLAMFNLGGVYWNSGDIAGAAKVWRTAIGQFPDHHLTAKLRQEFSFLFLDN
ncbi:tetratricopeptide repeat protein [Azospirillum brasilense]|uniref:tetratricopeptide repeat protein n=1 Tax=Azospirillum brasilense TaxID=192 RepID=UPI000E0A815B|nr:tetratricopeptide repeat protein [Azospirillum brasilense]